VCMCGCCVCVVVFHVLSDVCLRVWHGRQYDLLDNIGYKEDVHHSMFRELPDQIEAAILVRS